MDATSDDDTFWRIHPGTTYYTWSDAKDALADGARILSGALVDDSAWHSNAAGLAYYDEITIGHETFSGDATVAKGVCMDEGWEDLGFRNQGQCVASFAADDRSAH